ncbi:hypothetical protein CALCODRAFT_484576 [Calocera cornea HHB12733]|uniref:Uncharacterized protein n=1 Tax=Calocera cornea HHB12733 TaxID=1353952 RepID=A0A165EX67_9BASI|nr:hypothetical protein CALCODRAFT_484576 [Calocera cornea HHB12733]
MAELPSQPERLYLMESGLLIEKGDDAAALQHLGKLDRGRGSQSELRNLQALSSPTEDSVNPSTVFPAEAFALVAPNPAEVNLLTQQRASLHVDLARDRLLSSEPSTPVTPTRDDGTAPLQNVDASEDPFNLDSVSSLATSPISPPTTPKRNGAQYPSQARRHSVPLVSAERTMTRQSSDITSSTITPPDTPESRPTDAIRAAARAQTLLDSDNVDGPPDTHDGSPRKRAPLLTSAVSQRSLPTSIKTSLPTSVESLPAAPRRLIFNAGTQQLSYVSKRRAPSPSLSTHTEPLARHPKRIIFNTSQTPGTYESKKRLPTGKSARQSKHTIRYITKADADAAGKALKAQNARVAAKGNADSYEAGKAAVEAWLDQGIDLFVRRGYTETEALLRDSSASKKDKTYPAGNIDAAVALASGAIVPDASGLRARNNYSASPQDSGGRW